jgi:cyclopropane-fatty-acyl-phospholipid synthase
LTLEQAQRRKHEFIAEQLRIGQGTRVVDLGCGWGPFLHFARSRGADGVGVTLSDRQAAACRKNGLAVRVMDVMDVTPEALGGGFDVAVSLGAFEHFCSREQYRAGRQDQVYDRFFRAVHALLPARGRLFLQTMVFGKNMIPESQIDVRAPRLSDPHVLGVMAAQFPGSWLPYGKEQILTTSAPYFREITSESGRLDYIETIRQWEMRFGGWSLRKAIAKLSLLPAYLTSQEFRDGFTAGISANTICFERLLMDHYRIVLEKI